MIKSEQHEPFQGPGLGGCHLSFWSNKLNTIKIYLIYVMFGDLITSPLWGKVRVGGWGRVNGPDRDVEDPPTTTPALLRKGEGGEGAPRAGESWVEGPG